MYAVQKEKRLTPTVSSVQGKFKYKYRVNSLMYVFINEPNFWASQLWSQSVSEFILY